MNCKKCGSLMRMYPEIDDCYNEQLCITYVCERCNISDITLHPDISCLLLSLARDSDFVGFMEFMGLLVKGNKRTRRRDV